MMALVSVLPRSCGPGGCFTRNVAITPSSTHAVVPLSPTTRQNEAVSNASTTAIEPPNASMA
jgi:hypothetical protein